MIKLHYHNGKSNFGDIINENIFSDVLHRDFVHSSPASCNLFAIGSVLSKAFIRDKHASPLRNIISHRRQYFRKHFKREKIQVWGSGFGAQPLGMLKPFANLEFLAVRGKNTKQVLEDQLGYDLSDVVLGDPGLLFNRLVKKKKKKKYMLGLITHYLDSDRELVNQVQAANPQCVRINILGEPIEILNAINDCEFIVSSAMHGLIAADSLNIPNQWIRFADFKNTLDFKYNDYYSVFGFSPSVLDIRHTQDLKFDLDKIRQDYKITRTMVEDINDNLINIAKQIY